MNIGVIGGGSWATAIVKMLTNNQDNVNWWVRNPEVVKEIQKFGRNPRYLSTVHFDQNKLTVSSDMHEIIAQSDLLVMAIPSAFLASSLEGIDAQTLKDKIIFSAIKGIIPEHNVIPAKYFHAAFDIPYDRIGIICGPCHAEEVAMEKLSFLTLACSDVKLAEQMAEFLACRYIKTATSDDQFGAELAAVLKNVFAIASGIYHGLGYGDNFQALLISNGIQEMERFVDAVHPIHRDVKSSPYLGDLLVTAYSQFSRNRTFGTMVGKGYSVKAAQLEMNMVAEGYYAAKCIHEMNQKHEVEMPILDAVHNILYERISPILEMRILADKLG